ncbi:unnamed protein product, partial [Ixodes hexagonus]
MEELEQKDLLIQQLKDIVRSNEQILQQKEKELQETNAKLQKLKIQSKAKIAQLTHRVKVHEPSPETADGAQDAGGETGSPGQSAAERGRLRVLRHQLDEARQRLERSERESLASRKALEATVEQLQSQLVQRDQQDARTVLHRSVPFSGGRLPATSVVCLPLFFQEGDCERLYAQLVLKDSRILELSRQAESLEARILDLQESLREKDMVLQARTRAVQLVTEDLSLRSKAAVDGLDDTRAEMQRLQRDFLEREAGWREREAALGAELEQSRGALEQSRGTLEQSRDALRRAEATRFDLATRNAQLQQRLVEAQEAARGADPHGPDWDVNRCLAEKLASLEQQLQSKSAALEEALKETDSKVLKARALERRRAKALQKELEELKKARLPAAAPPENQTVTGLQQRIAELEEEKGALQLRALETEDTLSAQASKLEELAQKEAAIVELKRELKEAREEKISLEMRAAESEEQKETEERKMQSLERELEALKEAECSSAPPLEQELNAALRGEVESLKESLKAADNHSREAREQMESNIAKIEELERTCRESADELGRKSEQLEEVRLALEDATRALECKTKDADELLNTLAGLKASLTEAEDVQANLRAALSTKETEIQNVLESIGVSILEEVSTAWEELRRANSLEIEKYRNKMANLDGRNKEQAGKVESLESALEEAEAAKTRLAKVNACLESLSVSSVEELMHKWNSLNENLAIVTRTQKLNDEDVASQMKLLTDEKDNLRMEITAKESKIADLMSEISSVRTELEKCDSALAQEKAALAEAHEDVGRLKKALSTAKKKTEAKFKTLLEQSNDLEKEVSFLRAQLEEKCQLLEGAGQSLDTKCSQMEQAMRDFTMREAASEAQIAELMQQLRDKEQDIAALQEQLSATIEKTESEIASLQQSLNASLQASSSLQMELTNLRSSLEAMKVEKDSVDKQLKEVENELQKAQDAHKQLELSLCMVTADLESSQAASAELESTCTLLRERLDAAEAEKAHLSQRLSDSLQNTGEVRREKEALESRSEELSEVVGQLERGLCEAQHISQEKEKEMTDALCKLQSEKADICEELDRRDREKQALSLKLSEMEDKLERTTKQNEDLKQKEELVMGQLEELRKQYDDDDARARRQLEELAETCRTVTDERNLCKALLDEATVELRDVRGALAESREEGEVLKQACTDLKELNDRLTKEVSSLHLEQAKQQEELQRASEEKRNLSEAVANLEELVATKASQLDSLQVVLGSKDAELKSLRDSAEFQQSDLAIKLSETSKELQMRTGELSLARVSLEEREALVSSLKESVASLSSRLRESEKINKDLSLQVENLAERVSEASRAIEVKEASLQKMAEDVKTFMDTNSKHSSDLQLIQGSCKELNEAKQDLELKLNAANCKTADLETTLAEQDRTVGELRSELEATKTELVAAASKLEGTVSKVEEQELKLRAAAESESALLEEVARLQQEKQSMAVVLDELRSRSGTTQGDLDRSAELIATLRTELDEANSLCQDLRAKNDAEVASHEKQIAEKSSLVAGLEEEVNKLRLENKKTKEHLGLVSAEIESLVREQLAMFSAEIENMVQNHDQQLREFSEANVKLESEVANYVTKMADNECSIRDLEMRLECLLQENASVKNQLAQASTDTEESAQRHCVQVRELEERLQELDREVDRLRRVEETYRETGIESVVVRDCHEAAETRLGRSKQAVGNDVWDEARAVVEEVLVQSAAKLQSASKDSPKKGEGDAQMSQNEMLSKEPESARAEEEKLTSLLSSKEQDANKLLEELKTVKGLLETAETQLKSSSQEMERLRGMAQSPQSEETRETADLELKKLKVAFKKSRGELRLKLKILEDKTKELDVVKEQNSRLQADMQQMVETLSSEKLAAEELLHKVRERDDQLALAVEETLKLREECTAAKTDLAAALEKIAEEKAHQESLSERLKSAEIVTSSLRTQIEELQSKEAVTSVEDVGLLKSKLMQAESEMARLSDENRSLLACRSEEGQGLLSDLALAKAEIERMSLEHEKNLEASFGREQALQSECEAASALLGELHAQQAQFSEAKSEEFEALQAQLVSLSRDLAKQLELVDAKVAEADTLKEKFEASQLELERLSAEYCVLQDVLLQECGEEWPVHEKDSELREFSAFEYLKKLLGNAKSKREALEKLLAEREEQLKVLQQNYQSLEDRYQRPLQDLGEFVRSIIEHTNQSSEDAMALETGRLEDLNWLLAVLQEQVTSLKARNEFLNRETQQWKSSCEDASEKLKCLSNESSHWQQRYEEVAEALRKAEDIVKCHVSLQTEADEASAMEKGRLEVYAEKELLLHQVSQLTEEVATLKAASSGSADSLGSLQEELSATKLKFEEMVTELELFREKNTKLEEQLDSLRKAHGDLKEIHRHEMDEVSRLKDQCRALEEEVKTLSRDDRTEAIAQHLQQTFERAERAEAECTRLDESVRSLLERNGKLEIEANFLRSELSSLKEQAEMLVSDNETFQELAESLKQARRCLEEELKSQHEQHLKAAKELENEQRRALDEAAKSEAALLALKADHAQVQDKYNQIVYSHRDLQEEFHVVVQEKRHLEDKCTQLAEECATARRALAILEEQQGAVGQKTLQELQDLRQAHQLLQERLHHLKTEERLVQTQSPRVGTDAVAATKDTGDDARARLTGELEEVSRRYASLLEQSQAKEGKWNQERRQLKHVEEHLKDAAQGLSAELQELKARHEEALQAKQELGDRLDQMTRENRTLSQQVHNWRNYIRGFEESRAGGQDAPEVDGLRQELDQTARNLHQLGLRNEEMSVELGK